MATETKRGRPSRYTPETAREICARLATGESLRRICRDEDMPPESTVRGWVIDDVEGFSAQYARARDFGLDSIGDEIVEIADDGSNDTYVTEDGERVDYDHIQRSKLRVDARKWYLSKLAPKRYGDRLQHAIEPGSKLEVTVKHEVIDPAGNGG